MLIIPSPRNWSNVELRKVLAHLHPAERVINVSGWKDGDKEGGFYRSYFAPSTRYTVSNYGADAARGGEGTHTAVSLDLGAPIPAELEGAFDVAFSHTVLEHVEDPLFAFNQIAKLTSDLIITIIPFKQKLHFEPGNFGDYYRFSPIIMRRLHERAGFTVLYESFTPPPNLDVYLFYVGTRRPEQHTAFPVQLCPIEQLNFKVGEFNAVDLLRNVTSRAVTKFFNR
jgi:hypothetical protein